MFNSPDTTRWITVIDSHMLHVDHICEYTLHKEQEDEAKIDELVFHHPQLNIPPDKFIHNDL